MNSTDHFPCDILLAITSFTGPNAITYISHPQTMELPFRPSSIQNISLTPSAPKTGSHHYLITCLKPRDPKGWLRMPRFWRIRFGGARAERPYLQMWNISYCHSRSPQRLAYFLISPATSDKGNISRTIRLLSWGFMPIKEDLIIYSIPPRIMILVYSCTLSSTDGWICFQHVACHYLEIYRWRFWYVYMYVCMYKTINLLGRKRYRYLLENDTNKPLFYFIIPFNLKRHYMCWSEFL